MKIIFSDFDGTLTINGKLGAVFFDLLELIEKNNSELVIVSGRSLSWGHFLLTHFPLKRAIMEGGGVILSKTVDGYITEECLVSDSDLEKLQRTTIALQEEVPQTIMSVDSFGRKTDRAIEFPQMKPADVDKAQNYLKKHRANYSRSNVHVNYWYGDISKNFAIDYFLENYAPHIKKEETIFYGDSLNDESVFEGFPNTVGVSNIISVLDQLNHRPKIVLEGKENAGTNGVLAHLKEVFNQSVDF